jgi:hypothetical protein
VVSESDPIEFVTKTMFDQKSRVVAVTSKEDRSKVVGALTYESILDYIEMNRAGETDNAEK